MNLLSWIQPQYPSSSSHFFSAEFNLVTFVFNCKLKNTCLVRYDILQYPSSSSYFFSADFKLHLFWIESGRHNTLKDGPAEHAHTAGCRGQFSTTVAFDQLRTPVLTNGSIVNGSIWCEHKKKNSESNCRVLLVRCSSNFEQNTQKHLEAVPH